MAYARRSTTKDATWNRAWTADAVSDLTQLQTDGLPRRGDVAFVTATGHYYIWIDGGTWRVLPMSTYGQLPFPSTQNASADANTLDDYEEGTWTPIIGGAGGQSGQTYGLQDGRYTKVGKWVSLVALVYFSGAGGAKGTITGVVTIKGIPFTVGTGYSTGPMLWDSFAAAKVYCTLEAIPSTATMSLLGIAAANTTVLGANLVTADLGDSSLILMSATYEATG